MLLDERGADITRLDEALRGLWRQALECCDSEEPLNRALTMNFIAVCGKDGVAEQEELLQRLLVRHPCRAFLVDLDGDASEITASATANVRKQGNGHVMVLERIRLTTRPHDLPKLPGLIRPLLVNDIPVHFFWGTALPQDERLLLLLGELADQTTVDSGLFTSPELDLERTRKLPELRIVDLAWFRLAPWRRALAEAFDTFEWQAAPRTLVRLTHGRRPGAIAAVEALSVWLEQKLSAEVTATAVDVAAPSMEPLSLVVEHGNALVEVEHIVREPMLRVQTTLRDVCMLPFVRPASRCNQGDLLAAAVE